MKDEFQSNMLYAQVQMQTFRARGEHYYIVKNIKHESYQAARDEAPEYISEFLCPNSNLSFSVG